MLISLFIVKYFVWRLVDHHAELHEGDDGEKALPVQLKIMAESLAHDSELLYLGVHAFMTGVDPLMGSALRNSAPWSVGGDEYLLSLVFIPWPVPLIGKDRLAVVNEVKETLTEDGVVGPEACPPRPAHPGDEAALY